MKDIRQQIRSWGEDIQEALIVMNSWFVTIKDADSGLSTAPSQHPRRCEAIVAIGRNAGHTRASMVVQPYVRKEDGGFVWTEPVIAQYDQRTDAVNRVEGLVDDLFIP
jgi:hypothetical protein